VTTITIATITQDNVDRATATVIVDAESPDVLSMKDVVKLGESNYFAYKDYIETQQEIIRSRRIAYQVIKNLELRAKEGFMESKDPIDTLLKKLKVELLKDTRILKISVDDHDPGQASRIANEFASVYANSNITLKMKTSGEAQNWLMAEVDKQKEKVRDAELKLQAYKEKNDILSIENKENIINEALTKLNESYLDAQKNRISAETTYKSFIDGEGNINLVKLPTLLADNEILKDLKKEYLKQEAIFIEYKKVYKAKHPKMIQLLENMAYIKTRIKNEIETDYNYAKEEEAKFKKLVDGKKNESLDLERKVINYNALKRELETNERILDIVLNRLKETSISSQVQTNNIRVQDFAEAPNRPIKPKKKLNVAMAIILGFIGGAGLAFFRDYMDMTLKDPGQIAAMLEVPVLGSVPKVKPDGKFIKKRSDVDRVVEKDSTSLAAEAYRSIRTSLLFSLNHSSSAKSIVITSSVPKEGKTTTAVNLAMMIANSGEKVLLVDADMRKPRIHSIFNKENDSGLSQFLAGEKDFEGVVNPSGIDNLYFVTAGKITHRSSELLSSNNAKLFLEKAGSLFSKIIFDTPPVGLVTDAAILASICTGAVMIAESSKATSKILTRSKGLLEKVDARILGIIVNNTSITNDTYYYPHYYYGKYYKPLNAK
jgi:capsular exopolysaccharide synthesis family protein